MRGQQGRSQKETESFLFLFCDVLCGFPTVSTPDCWEMPRHSGLSFLLGFFHIAELTSAFVLPRLVWPFPSANAESV